MMFYRQLCEDYWSPTDNMATVLGKDCTGFAYGTDRFLLMQHGEERPA